MSAFVGLPVSFKQPLRHPFGFLSTPVLGALPRIHLGVHNLTTCNRCNARYRVRSPPFQGKSPTMVSSSALEVAKFLAGPCINVFNFVMIVRIILSWYPKTDLAKAPWIYIAVPTEPLLRATRKVIQPIGGVDISPIVWFAIMSFVHEILVGPQGLLILLSQK